MTERVLEATLPLRAQRGPVPLDRGARVGTISSTEITGGDVGIVPPGSPGDRAAAGGPIASRWTPKPRRDTISGERADPSAGNFIRPSAHFCPLRETRAGKPTCQPILDPGPNAELGRYHPNRQLAPSPGVDAAWRPEQHQRRPHGWQVTRYPGRRDATATRRAPRAPAPLLAPRQPLRTRRDPIRAAGTVPVHHALTARNPSGMPPVRPPSRPGPRRSATTRRHRPEWSVATTTRDRASRPGEESPCPEHDAHSAGRR